MKLRLPVALVLCICACLQSFFLSAQCVATGPKDGTTASNNTSTGTLAWVNPTNAESSNTTYATASQSLSLLQSVKTNYLVVQNFGFSFAATDSICGILVEIKRHGSGVGLYSITDNKVLLTSGGSITGTVHAGGAWPTSDAYASYGGISDLWGAASWTPAQINSATFGVAFSASLNAAIAGALSASVDEIRVTVYAHAATSLAITMEQFTATAGGQTTLLSWSASSNDNLDQFRIERSPDSKNWQDIASVNALPGENQYTYRDEAPLPGSNYYRLLLENYGDAPTFSIVKEVFFQDPGKHISVYPNPIADIINVSGAGPIGRVILRDTQGRTLKSVIPSGSAGTLQIPVSGLAKGIYLLQVDQQVFEVLKQ